MPRWSVAVRVLRGIVVGVILVVGLATVLGLLDRVSWIFELADVFRLQYLVVLAGAALGALLLRRPRLAGAAAVLAAVNVAVLGISLIPTATAASRRRDLFGLWSPTSRWATPTSPRSGGWSHARTRTSSE
jgi:hypothetical protein